MNQIVGQISIFDLDLINDYRFSDPISFFDNYFCNGSKFYFGVTRTPVSVLDIQKGDKCFKMYLTDFGFWHYCYKKSLYKYLWPIK